ncbi:MAG: haloacid dehalogenase [Candidatus Altarchaeum sp. CG03_land_8_20_14_0_80_32_618]|nr:MAG: haloacid dehalogenase [Candidatus Altarchaeum sp. CG03_land_8_20_14_0_80_32_618]PJC14724.1 MAG: haloacid dehalogenase [Candidatus Altarchaeum sp. CG_4_9_14_0_8_um_filter_32_206]
MDNTNFSFRMKIKAVLFDMDGVVVDSERYFPVLERYWFASLIRKAWTDDDEANITGRSASDIYNVLKEQYNLGIDKNLFLKHYDKIARDVYENKCNLTQNFLNVVDNLREKKLKIAMVSSSPYSWIEMMLKRFKIRNKFDVVISADELNSKGKPSPAIYLHSAKILNLNPENCVVIEDSKNGIVSAKNAKMFCIGFRNGINENQDLNSADKIIYNLKEILNFLAVL